MEQARSPEGRPAGLTRGRGGGKGTTRSSGLHCRPDGGPDCQFFEWCRGATVRAQPHGPKSTGPTGPTAPSPARLPTVWG